MGVSILLIEPPFERLKGITATHFQLGLGYLAAVLMKEGHKVWIYNADLAPDTGDSSASITKLLEIHERYPVALKNDAHPVWKEVLAILNKYKPDVVGLTAKTPIYPSAQKIAQIIKEKYNKNCPVILGGPHATIASKNVLEDKNIDFIIIGEGELTIKELIKAIENKARDFSSIKGIGYKKDGKIILTQPRELIQNLDELPFPARDAIVEENKYPLYEMGRIETARGCPFMCEYCASNLIWTRKLRTKSPSYVIKEIKHLMQRYKLKTFYFIDDTFTANKKRVIELCNAIIKDKLNIEWGCETRVDLVDDEVISWMKKAGCNKIDVGIETGSPRMLKIVKKGTTIGQAIAASKLFNKHGIGWNAFLMMGFPEETKEDMQQTIDLIKKIKPDTIIFSIFTPYPGTALHKRAMELGLLPENPRWELYSHQSPNNAFVKNISREEFKKMAVKMIRTVDAYNNSLRAVIKRIKPKRNYFLKHPFEFAKKGMFFLKMKLKPAKLEKSMNIKDKDTATLTKYYSK